ncbi:hypothetical protein [Deinococcus knuensis]|uniref:Uncharacterized protein n=1 Tax=Deinococcus knuensis TaxID=1837380 RepID=A0ABQ2SXF0_9DEIO|nr:hypothetical protein [Deinococcus knuensis]GGS41211.1 hypothetical protein GCM10008961_35580 [Deinococcus knuensis]
MTIKIRLRGKHKAASGTLLRLTTREARQLQRRALLAPVIRLPFAQGFSLEGGTRHRHPGNTQMFTSPDLLLSEPYDWGPQGRPAVKPFRYVPGQGWDMGED